MVGWLGWLGLDLSKNTTPPRAPSGANKQDITQVLIKRGIIHRTWVRKKQTLKFNGIGCKESMEKVKDTIVVRRSAS